MAKAFIIIGLATTALLIFRARPTAVRLALMRLATMVVLTLGVVAVLLPGSVTELANSVGVGRGADLVLYVLVLAFLLTSVALYRKLLDLQDRYVELARQVAVHEALCGNESSESTIPSR